MPNSAVLCRRPPRAPELPLLAPLLPLLAPSLRARALPLLGGARALLPLVLLLALPLEPVRCLLRRRSCATLVARAQLAPPLLPLEPMPRAAEMLLPLVLGAVAAACARAARRRRCLLQCCASPAGERERRDEEKGRRGRDAQVHCLARRALLCAVLVSVPILCPTTTTARTSESSRAGPGSRIGGGIRRLTFLREIFLGRGGVFCKKTPSNVVYRERYATSANGGLHMS